MSYQPAGYSACPDGCCRVGIDPDHRPDWNTYSGTPRPMFEVLYLDREGSAAATWHGDNDQRPPLVVRDTDGVALK